MKMNIIFEIFVGTMIVVMAVAVITFFVSKFINKQSPSGMIFLGKLANTDSSIDRAMDYLKLTNSIADKANGSV
jgi:hypothetical protein